MRFPAEENDRLAGFFRAGDLRQHPLLGGFDDFERLQSECILGHHVEDQAVAVITGLDAVNLAAKRVAVRGDVLEILDAEFGTLGVGRQRILGAGQVFPQRFDRFVFAVRRDIPFHGRHPVAEENIVFVFQGCIGNGNREKLDVGFIA